MGLNFSTENFAVGEILFSKYSGLDVFNAFIPNFTENGLFCSQLRIDNKPTCSVFQTNNGYYLYKDFGTGETLTPIKYVMKLYNIGAHQATNLIWKTLESKGSPPHGS